jgi:hypothetical protein
MMQSDDQSGSYEGKTMRLTPVCPMCGGVMDEGFLVDRGDYGVHYQSEWIAGPPEPSRWTGGVHTHRRLRYGVSTLRCQRCGFLASYAVTPLDDV